FSRDWSSDVCSSDLNQSIMIILAMITRAVMGFRDLTDHVFRTFVRVLLGKMTGNLNYTDPEPPLSVIETKLETFETALDNVSRIDKLSIETKNAARADLESSLRTLCYYVNQQGKGDATVLLSSGFDINKVKESPGPLPPPGGFFVTAVSKGKMKVGVKANKYAQMYMFQYKPADEEVWTEVTSGKSRIILEDLESYRVYDFRATYIGTNPSRSFT